MNRLKGKASRFFKNAPNADEQTANAESGGFGADFDAGIGGVGGGAGVKKLGKKPSRFFAKKDSNASGEEIPAAASPKSFGTEPGDAIPVVKKPSGFATLKSKSSRFFKPLPPNRPFPKISNPIPLISSPLSPTREAYTPPPPAPTFQRPAGPPPPRPERPDSLDSEIVAFMKAAATRTGLRTSGSSAGTQNRARSTTLTRASIEARLGLPSGRTLVPPSPVNPPASPSTRFPNGAIDNISDDDNNDDNDSTRNHMLATANETLRWSAGDDPAKREVWRKSNEGRWTTEQRVQGRPGMEGGTLYKDERGLRHLIMDV